MSSWEGVVWILIPLPGIAINASMIGVIGLMMSRNLPPGTEKKI